MLQCQALRSGLPTGVSCMTGLIHGVCCREIIVTSSGKYVEMVKFWIIFEPRHEKTNV